MTLKARAALLVFGAATTLAPLHAMSADAASAYPTHPIRLILGYPPGGASDAVARLLAQSLGARWGQTLVIDNRGGAGGNIAADLAARAAPDGYTWFLGNNGILATNQALYEKLPFDPIKDFTTVTLVATQPSVLVLHPSLPVSSVRELIALAKAKPGALNYASSGTGTAGHLTGELFKAVTQTSFVHIPYKGGGPAVIDLVAGQVQFMFATAASVIPHVRSNRLHAIAVTSLKRSPSLPDLPTVDESGVPRFEAITWHGIVVPAATPRPVVDKINAALNEALAAQDMKDKLALQGVEARGGTSAEFAAFLKSEIPKWTKVVRDSGAKPE
ncbi:MAG: hypothetical protein JWN94_2571 [Betaproteobacteria bacterium]|nr:hypothetical protein [Betaproteobacteria bacterium]